MKVHTALLIERKGWRPGWKKGPHVHRSLCGRIKDGVSILTSVAEQNCRRCLLIAAAQRKPAKGGRRDED